MAACRAALSKKCVAAVLVAISIQKIDDTRRAQRYAYQASIRHPSPMHWRLGWVHSDCLARRDPLPTVLINTFC